MDEAPAGRPCRAPVFIAPAVGGDRLHVGLQHVQSVAGQYVPQHAGIKAGIIASSWAGSSRHRLNHAITDAAHSHSSHDKLAGYSTIENKQVHMLGYHSE